MIEPFVVCLDATTPRRCTAIDCSCGQRERGGGAFVGVSEIAMEVHKYHDLRSREGRGQELPSYKGARDNLRSSEGGGRPGQRVPGGIIVYALFVLWYILCRLVVWFDRMGILLCTCHEHDAAAPLCRTRKNLSRPGWIELADEAATTV